MITSAQRTLAASSMLRVTTALMTANVTMDITKALMKISAYVILGAIGKYLKRCQMWSV